MTKQYYNVCLHLDKAILKEIRYALCEAVRNIPKDVHDICTEIHGGSTEYVDAQQRMEEAQIHLSNLTANLSIIDRALDNKE